jgi:hypothetical protein
MTGQMLNRHCTSIQQDWEESLFGTQPFCERCKISGVNPLGEGAAAKLDPADDKPMQPRPELR